MRDDLKKSDSESHEIEMNMMENGDYGKQSRNFSVAGLAVAVSEATAEPRSTAIHGQHVQPEDATGVVKAERSMRRALSDFIFVASKPPATII